MLEAKLKQKHEHLAQVSLHRYQEEIDYTDGIYLYLNGQRYLSFSTNNYLGLAHHPNVVNACQTALKKYGVGSGSAYLISGYTSLHHQLEEELAEFLRFPQVLLFSSGYLANIGVISTLFSKNDLIIGDKLNHASIVDGCLASKALTRRYPHLDMKALAKHCQQSISGTKLIVSEGLFGMDGTLAPLPCIKEIASQQNAIVMIDDAHGIGVIGEQGRGTLEHHGLGSDDVSILTGTLGKAFGSYGAFVASSEPIINSLIQCTRTYIYTTAIPPSIAAASLASLKIIQEEPSRRAKLTQLICYFKKGVQDLNIPCLDSYTPIQLVMIGNNQRCLAISYALRQKGLFIKAIRPPTVPLSSARLRITITAEHTESQIDFLLESLAHAIKYT